MATKEILISTTGTLSPVVINDLGARTFYHPLTDYNLLVEYHEDEIRDSVDIQTAVDNGWITLKDENGNVINNIGDIGPHYHFQTDVVDFDHPLDDLIAHTATSDTTDFDVSETAHGLMPKLSGDPGEYLDGESTWKVPFRSELLTYTDTSNKIIGPLDVEPATYSEVDLFTMLGTLQEYTKDFTVREISGTTPGFYICISPSSSAPAGNWFLGGMNPGTGIESILETGDKVKANYSS